MEAYSPNSQLESRSSARGRKNLGRISRCARRTKLILERQKEGALSTKTPWSGQEPPRSSHHLLWREWPRPLPITTAPGPRGMSPAAPGCRALLVKEAGGGVCAGPGRRRKTSARFGPSHYDGWREPGNEPHRGAQPNWPSQRRQPADCLRYAQMSSAYLTPLHYP